MAARSPVSDAPRRADIAHLWPLYVCRACGLPVRDRGEGAPKECPECWACTWMYQRTPDDSEVLRGPVLKKMVFKIMVSLRRKGRL